MTVRRVLAVALLLGCSSSPTAERPAVVAPPPSPAASTRAIDGIHAVLDPLENGSPVGVADDYVEVSCGAVQRHPNGAGARLVGASVGEWELGFAPSHDLAWAVGKRGDKDPFYLAVLERRGAAWQLVAGAVSYHDTKVAPCTDAVPPASIEMPAGTDVGPIGIADDTHRIVCGEPREDDALAPLQRSIRLSTSGTTAWAIGEAADGTRTLDALELRRAGWTLAATLWSPPPSVAAKRCPPPRGRVVVSDDSIEILDHITFDKDNDVLNAGAKKVLDAVASTLLGNPSIMLVAIEAHASSDETEPVPVTERRGLAIRTYLVEKGVPIDRLQVEFYGDAIPVDANAGESMAETRLRSRRIQFRIVTRKE